MSIKRTHSIQTSTSSKRLFVYKRNIVSSLNENCCGKDLKKVQLAPTKVKVPIQTKTKSIPKVDESIIEVPVQTKALEIPTHENLPLFYEIISNAWPISKKRVENLTITNKRCQFSNEAISIKPITAVPGIGKKYGQSLADHGFIYARQLLGYYMILKDSEIFRKWLEYRFHIPCFRAAETTSALNELIRRTL